MKMDSGTVHDGRTRTYSLEEILTEKKIYNTRASAFHTAACFSFFLENNTTVQYSGKKSTDEDFTLLMLIRKQD